MNRGSIQQLLLNHTCTCGVGLCLGVRLGARCNKLKLVRQATQAARTSVLGLNQSGGDLGYVGVFWLFFGLFVVVFLGGGGVVQTVKLAEGCCCFLLLLQMTTGYKIQVLVAAALLLLLSEYKFHVISF